MTPLKIAAIIAAILTLAVVPFAGFDGLSTEGHIALAIFLLAAVFWMFEPVPIYATSLLVIFLQVMLLSSEGAWVSLGFANYEGVSFTTFTSTLAHPIILLFLGGFMLASAAVKFNLDKSVTRLVLKPFGSKPMMIVCGLMLVTALLSAFMSNTATTSMMMTVILPVIAALKPEDRLRVGVALCIPTAANIGGIATPIGTPPNAIVLAALANEGIRIPFGTWIMLTLPLVIVSLVASWLILMALFKPTATQIELNFDGTFNRTPKALLLTIVFLATIGLWMTEALHGMNSNVIAFLPVAALPLFGVLDKHDIRKLPWEVLWLVAGGISLGVSMQNTGLAGWLVGMVDWASLSALMLLLLIGVVTFLLANFLSHTVTATLITPIALGLGIGATTGELADFNAVIAGLVIAVASSFGMVLPISTPPNAIAISTGLVETKDMAKVGILVGIIGLALTMLCAKLYWPLFQFTPIP